MRRELKQKLLLFKVNVYTFLKYRKNKKTVAILSAKKWQNKVSDDIFLKQELIKHNFNAKIIAWEEDIDYHNFDLVVVRSIWGYEKNMATFEKFLNKLLEKNVQVLNDISIMKNNYGKEKQFRLLDKYDIPHVETIFIPACCKDIALEVKENLTEEMIIKPSISASGNNTYLINSASKRKNSLSLKEVNSKFKSINKTTSLMLQPFMKEIDEGEISLIYIDGKFSHAIMRFPSLFNNYKGISYISNVPKELFSLGAKVLKIKEYQNALFERIDVVKVDDKYIVMELELVEPDFFIRNIPSKSVQKEVLEKLVIAIKNRL